MVSGYQFKAIQNSDPFITLQKDIIIPKHNEIAYNAIFQHAKLELDQVENDILRIFATISKDVITEIKQGELLDSKLKSTHKHLRHSYKRISNSRIKNGKYTLTTSNPVSSKHLNHIGKTMNKCDNELKDIELMSSNIIENIVTINNRFIEDDNVPIISLDNLSEQQYPTLFKLLKQKHPEVMTQRIKKASKLPSNNEVEFVTLEGESSPAIQYSNSPLLTQGSLGASVISNKVGDFFNVNSDNNDNEDVDKTKVPPLIPLFLHKKSIPSTFTTLQNISGANLIENSKTENINNLVQI